MAPPVELVKMPKSLNNTSYGAATVHQNSNFSDSHADTAINNNVDDDLRSVKCSSSRTDSMTDASSACGVGGTGSLSADELSEGRSAINFIWKDVLVVSVGFLCNFIAFNGLSNVQSTLNSEGGLGTASMGVIYASLIISSFILPPVMIKHLGCKWTIVTCIPFYTLYIVANFYATWWTLIPTSVLVGLAAAPLWSAKCSYLTTLSHRYVMLYNAQQLSKNGGTLSSQHQPLKVEAVNSKFFGLFFAIFHFDSIIGNLISSLTLNPASSNDHEESLQQCGIDYCDDETASSNVSTTATVILESLYENVTNALVTFHANYSNATYGHHEPVGAAIGKRPDLSNVYAMCGIYAALSFSGCMVIAIFLRPLKATSGCGSSATLTGWQLFKVSLRQAINPFQLLMMPLTVFSGLAQSFMTSDFTKAFVSCTLGIHFIGFVMLCTGVTDAIFSLGFGVALKYVHRSVVYSLGALICLALYITMFVWVPTVDTSIGFYVISSFWGIADSVWQTHFNAFYGILFPDNLEVAFASYRLWESIGYMTGFAWSNSVCVRVKLAVIVALLVVGMITYAAVELKLRYRDRHNKPDTAGKEQ